MRPLFHDIVIVRQSKRTARNTSIEQLWKMKLQNNKPYKQSYFTSKKISKGAIKNACNTASGPQYLLHHFRGHMHRADPANRESLYIRNPKALG
jgi:hypothetical protein